MDETSAHADTKVAILLAAAALAAAGIGIRAATLSDSGTDTYNTAVREDVRRGARLVSDVRRLYSEDAVVAQEIAESQLLAEEEAREARASDGAARVVLAADAEARRQLALALSRPAVLGKDPKTAPDLTADDLLVRLAALRRAAGPAARLNPDATEEKGADEARRGSLLTATVVIVAFAFLCGALAAAFPSAQRRLRLAGTGLVATGVLSAILVEALA